MCEAMNNRFARPSIQPNLAIPWKADCVHSAEPIVGSTLSTATTLMSIAAYHIKVYS